MKSQSPFLRFCAKAPRRVGRLVTRRAFGTVTGVRTQTRAVALTFDDGPHPEYTPRLLEVLQRHRASATLFMVGEMAARHPAVVRQVAEAGHAIGNHSWDHPSMPAIGSEERRRQIRACAAVTAPYALPIFRPPYGHQTPASRWIAMRLGYDVIGWDTDVEDWIAQDALALSKRLVAALRPGGIVVLHDAISDVRDERAAARGYAIEALDRALTELADAFRFVTVPELMRLGKPVRAHWHHVGDPAWLAGTSTPWAKRYAEAL